MKEKSIKLEMVENDIINVIFSHEEIIKIGTNGDIDLTNYVNRLFRLINDCEKIRIDKIESDNLKINLVQNTIVEITESFNECIEDVEDE
jgi:hypothetical protein